MSESENPDITADDAPADTAVELDEPAELDADANDTDEDDNEDTSGGLLVREGDIAADYLERLLDIVDYDGDIDLDVENDRAVVAIVGSDLLALVGADGSTLEALQELTRLAVQQKTGNRSRLMLDISNFRAQRRTDLQDLAASTAASVLADKEPARLAPMNPFERKVVHDAIGAIAGVRSESEGEEPNRRVLVLLDD
ncbi:MAG: putative RNA-binding protein [Pseudonocardiales bacterium]|nr:putative RNA-binding protein [Pseudonocardiales bacterium]